MDKIFKVVSKLHCGAGVYESYYILGFPSVSYKIGEFVQAKPDLLKLGYGLTAFRTQSEAYEFASGDFYSEIYLATGVGKIARLPKRLLVSTCYNIEDFKRFDPLYQDWPEGTVMYQKIRLDQKDLVYSR